MAHNKNSTPTANKDSDSEAVNPSLTMDDLSSETPSEAADKLKQRYEENGKPPPAATAGPAAEYLTIEQHRAERQLSNAIFAGVCSRMEWHSGRMVTRQEFTDAVEAFLASPVRGIPRTKGKEGSAC